MLGNALPIFSRAERNTPLPIIIAAIASALILILLLKRNPNTPYRIIVNVRAVERETILLLLLGGPNEGWLCGLSLRRMFHTFYEWFRGSTVNSLECRRM